MHKIVKVFAVYQSYCVWLLISKILKCTVGSSVISIICLQVIY